MHELVFGEVGDRSEESFSSVLLADILTLLLSAEHGQVVTPDNQIAALRATIQRPSWRTLIRVFAPIELLCRLFADELRLLAARIILPSASQIDNHAHATRVHLQRSIPVVPIGVPYQIP